MTIIEEVKPTARKTHRCECCYRTIRAGEVYTRSAHIYDGDFCVWKECSHCTAFINHIGWEYIEDSEGGYNPDSVNEGAEDYVLGNEKATEYDRLQLTHFRNRWRNSETDKLLPVPYQENKK